MSCRSRHSCWERRGRAGCSFDQGSRDEFEKDANSCLVKLSLTIR
ncbi:hypothetical protein USDA257_c42390 [Sinorhizobium fredii USDA 257]|uniref:Uncharacterized protein n=1 Tax=Sinorhizobium fredii (strain USDA 257) TaxID=1185652 RepID=I3XA72_SINF2|nr:hypothetical protein USDA257_c42390 [Sinorhizobium fredii USDA 257]